MIARRAQRRSRDERERLFYRFHKVLTTAQTERDRRPDIQPAPGGGLEFAWTTHERDVMHQEVNRVRAERGLPPVPAEAILRAERQAVGHFDYTRKFALYCAELATDPSETAGGAR